MQMTDGSDVMLFQLRRKDGSIDPHSSGSFIEPSGRTSRVTGAMTPGRRWTSPIKTGGVAATYPVEWSVRIPEAALDLRVRAVVDDQELRTPDSTGVTYWEGAIDVTGTHAGTPIRGRGYLEMTGYAGRAMGDVMR